MRDPDGDLLGVDGGDGGVHLATLLRSGVFYEERRPRCQDREIRANDISMGLR
jgi:hypothetical protein